MGLLTDLGDRIVYLDANVFIYALEGHPELVASVRELLQAVDSGGLPAVTSELTLAELLVGPFRTGRVELQRAYLSAVHERDGLRVAPVTKEVLVESARIRAREAVRLPDGIHLATAHLERCEAFLSNDQRIRSRPGLEIVRLPRA